MSPKKNFTFSHKKPSQGDLSSILKKSATLAKKKNFQAFLYIKAQGCQPCSLIEKNLEHPQLKEIFSNCYFIKVDYFSWMLELNKLHIYPETAPYFVRINNNGEICNYALEAGDWESDSPEDIAKNLKPYFSDREDKPILHVSKQMLCKKITCDVMTGDYQEIRNVIDRTKCNPHYLSESNQSYLHLACAISRNIASEERILVIVNYFLSLGIDVNKQSNIGYTALRESIFHKYYDVANTLLLAGANVNLHTEDGETPLHRAVFDDALYMVKLLNKYGADFNAQDNIGRTPLHFMPTNDVNLAKFLLENSSNTNIPDKNGDTPFHYLLMKSQFFEETIPFIILYLKNGADLSIVNEHGLSPVEMVNNFENSKPHHSKVLNLLILKA